MLINATQVVKNPLENWRSEELFHFNIYLATPIVVSHTPIILIRWSSLNLSECKNGIFVFSPIRPLPTKRNSLRKLAGALQGTQASQKPLSFYGSELVLRLNGEMLFQFWTPMKEVVRCTRFLIFSDEVLVLLFSFDLMKTQFFVSWLRLIVMKYQSINQSINQQINQSIDESNYHWLKNAARIYFRNFTSSIYLAKTNVLTLGTLKWLFQNLCEENKRKEIIDWRGAFSSDSWQLCWRMRHLDRSQVTWPTTYGSVNCIQIISGNM